MRFHPFTALFLLPSLLRGVLVVTAAGGSGEQQGGGEESVLDSIRGGVPFFEKNLIF
jgi:hypothetical protein